ncbi:hypothetical protein [Paenibacillus sp. FSL H8-0034]|uniref:hypothetical protein n=1 Tax=Paenibacillus sp. FSL H8-0034 TaxID=2954671 RepID=UPI0030FB5606
MEILIDDLGYKENNGKIIVEIAGEEGLEISIIQAFEHGMKANIKLNKEHVELLLNSLYTGLASMKSGSSFLEREAISIINVDSKSKENTGVIIVSQIANYLILCISLRYFGDPELLLNRENVELLIKTIEDLILKTFR